MQLDQSLSGRRVLRREGWNCMSSQWMSLASSAMELLGSVHLHLAVRRAPASLRGRHPSQFIGLHHLHATLRHRRVVVQHQARLAV